MKTLNLFTAFCLMIVVHFDSFSQILFYKTFSESCPSQKSLGNSWDLDEAMVNKEHASYPHFDITIKGNSNQDVVSSLENALSLWESSLVISNMIRIEIEPMESASRNAYNVIVSYSNRPDETILLPTALLKQQGLNNDIVDMKIQYNPDMSMWDFDGNVDAGRYDCSTAMLRAVAKGLGFSSGLAGVDGHVFFKAASPFKIGYDSHIFNSSNLCLVELKSNTEHLNSFVKQPAFFVTESGSKYQLYTPDSYNQDCSLAYFFENSNEFDIEKALMYPFPDGVIHYIGNKVLDVMETIGWTVRRKIKIHNRYLTSGIAFPFVKNENLTFEAKGFGVITQHNWKFEIRLGQNLEVKRYYTVASSTEPVFEITMPEGFDVTSCRDLDGCVHGRISLDAEIDGVRQSDEFGLLIRYRPGKPIMDIVVEPYDNNPDYCDITFGFYTMLEEGHYEYGFGQYGVHYYYPMPDVKLGYNRLVEKNRYMGADLFIEFYHYDEYSGSGGDWFVPRVVYGEQNEPAISDIYTSFITGRVYSIAGELVATLNNQRIADLNLKKGVYVLLIIDSDGNTSTVKIIV